eukprot:4115730-Lingulodinium_polyedra.AAC.1
MKKKLEPKSAKAKQGGKKAVAETADAKWGMCRHLLVWDEFVQSASSASHRIFVVRDKGEKAVRIK